MFDIRSLIMLIYANQDLNPLRLHSGECNYISPNVITFAKLRPTKPEGGKCNYIQM